MSTEAKLKKFYVEASMSSMDTEVWAANEDEALDVAIQQWSDDPSGWINSASFETREVSDD